MTVSPLVGIVTILALFVLGLVAPFRILGPAHGPDRIPGMASPHTGPLIAASAVLAAVGGSFMAVTASEPSKAPRSVLANGWFDFGLAFVILGLVILAIGLFLHFRNRASKRIEVEITPERLTGFFKGVTAVQGQDQAARFVDKWMRLSGSLLDVSLIPRHRAISLILRHRAMVTFAEWSIGSRAEVTCFFSRRKWVDRIALKSRGDKVTVLGRITEVNNRIVYLYDCELVTQDLHSVAPDGEPA